MAIGAILPGITDERGPYAQPAPARLTVADYCQCGCGRRVSSHRRFTLDCLARITASELQARGVTEYPDQETAHRAVKQQLIKEIS